MLFSIVKVNSTAVASEGGLCAPSLAVLAEVVCKLEEAKTALLVSILSQMSK